MRAHAVCRMALVQVLFESQPGPAIPESDPELRAVLLDSLKTYERDEAQRPAFGEQPHIPVPEAPPSTSKLLLISRLLRVTMELPVRSSLQASPALVHYMLYIKYRRQSQSNCFILGSECKLPLPVVQFSDTAVTGSETYARVQVRDAGLPSHAVADAAQAAARRAEQASSSSRVAPSSYPAVKHAEPSAPPGGAAAPEQAAASAPPMPEHLAQACPSFPPSVCSQSTLACGLPKAQFSSLP